MVEVYLISTGLIFFGWLYALVRQTQKGVSEHQSVESRPIVPVNLLESDEAVLVAADRGRIVFANDQARRWFGIDGGTPSLNLISQLIQPRESLPDLVAEAGHASFRLAQRRIEAVSHAIPTDDGPRMVVVMRELTAAGTHVYTEFDPLRALAILGDISDAVGTGADLYTTIEAVLRSGEQSITYDAAQILVWDADSDTLRSMG